MLFKIYCVFFQFVISFVLSRKMINVAILMFLILHQFMCPKILKILKCTSRMHLLASL